MYCFSFIPFLGYWSWYLCLHFNILANIRKIKYAIEKLVHRFNLFKQWQRSTTKTITDEDSVNHDSIVLQ